MSDSCIFCRIAAGQVPASFVYQDDEVVAFPDLRPQAPVHVLVVPRRHVGSLAELDDPVLGGRLLLAVRAVAERQGIAERGFRTVVNTGHEGGQTVPHLHLHVLGGRTLDEGALGA